MRRRVIAVVVVTIFLAIFVRSLGQRHDRAPSSDPHVRALVDAQTGEELVPGWRVHAFEPARDGVARLELARGDSYVSVGITKRGNDPNRRAMISTERYDLMQGWTRGEKLPRELYPAPDVLVDAVATRIRKHEAELPLLPGVDAAPAPAGSATPTAASPP
jgi:hypothetical protein